VGGRNPIPEGRGWRGGAAGLMRSNPRRPHDHNRGAGSLVPTFSALLAEHGRSARSTRRDLLRLSAGIVACGLFRASAVSATTVALPRARRIRFLTGDGRLVKAAGPDRQNVTGLRPHACSSIVSVRLASLLTADVCGCRPRARQRRLVPRRYPERTSRVSIRFGPCVALRRRHPHPRALDVSSRRGCAGSAQPDPDRRTILFQPVPTGADSLRLPPPLTQSGRALGTVPIARWVRRASVSAPSQHRGLRRHSFVGARAVAPRPQIRLATARSSGAASSTGFGAIFPNSAALKRRVKDALSRGQAAPGRLPLVTGAPDRCVATRPISSLRPGRACACPQLPSYRVRWFGRSRSPRCRIAPREMRGRIERASPIDGRVRNRDELMRAMSRLRSRLPVIGPFGQPHGNTRGPRPRPRRLDPLSRGELPEWIAYRLLCVHWLYLAGHWGWGARGVLSNVPPPSRVASVLPRPGAPMHFVTPVRCSCAGGDAVAWSSSTGLWMDTLVVARRNHNRHRSTVAV